MTRSALPEATVGRLHHYRRILVELRDGGTTTVSSGVIAGEAGVNSAQVRKDLSLVGTRGTRGVGYSVVGLYDELTDVLGLRRGWRVAIVGIGNLGRALAAYRGFHEPGFSVAALLDADPALHGEVVAGVEIEPVDEIDEIVERRGVDIAVLAVPADVAQEVADRVAEAGVTAILNFAPTHVTPARGVRVRRVDLSTELGVLAYLERSAGRLDSEQATRHASPARHVGEAR